MQGEVYEGKYEVVPQKKIEDVWKELSKQDVLTSDNLELNLEVATEAWKAGGRGRNNGKRNGKSNGESSPPMAGLGDGFDEEDDSLVFKSNVKVETLSDQALRNWVTTFLLGLPSLGR